VVRILFMTKKPADAGCPKGALKVLLVDDEQDLLEVLSYELGEVGFEVTAVASGSEAIEAAQRAHFDVVITDLKMPGMDGVETMTTLRQIDPKLPVIVATGYASDGARLAFDACGSYEVILKPFTVTEIVMLLDRATAQRRTLSAKEAVP
jgi:CheY-like chemotaxis protein